MLNCDNTHNSFERRFTTLAPKIAECFSFLGIKFKYIAQY